MWRDGRVLSELEWDTIHGKIPVIVSKTMPDGTIMAINIESLMTPAWPPFKIEGDVMSAAGLGMDVEQEPMETRLLRQAVDIAEADAAHWHDQWERISTASDAILESLEMKLRGIQNTYLEERRVWDGERAWGVEEIHRLNCRIEELEEEDTLGGGYEGYFESESKSAGKLHVDVGVKFSPEILDILYFVNEVSSYIEQQSAVAVDYVEENLDRQAS